MATYILDDPNFSSLTFRKDLWKDEDICNVLSSPYPALNRVSSKSENLDFSWLFGLVVIEGEGKVKVNYPYSEEHLENFLLRNVCFSYFPYVYIEAEGEVFDGWYDGSRNLICTTKDLLISSDSFKEVTEFIARFTG